MKVLRVTSAGAGIGGVVALASQLLWVDLRGGGDCQE